MASIIIEDGTQVAGANSYITEAELTTYATDRGVTIAGNNDELLIQAMDFIEQQSFKGYKYTDAQPLQWPRSDVYIDGYRVEVTEIPQLLKDALAETALAIDGANNPLNNIDRQTKREKVGEIEIEYMDNASSSTYVPKISNKLRKLITGGNGGNNIRVGRA